MIIIFLFTIILISYIYKKTNLTWSVIVGIFVTSAFLNNGSLALAASDIISIPITIIGRTNLLLIFVSFILLYTTSNILNFIGFFDPIYEYMETKSKSVQKIFVLIASGLATNLDFSSSKIYTNHREEFLINTSITPHLIPFSSYSLFIYIIVIYNLPIVDKSFPILLISAFNFTLIWWLIKTIINSFNDIDLSYNIDRSVFDLLIPSNSPFEINKTVTLKKRHITLSIISCIIISLIISKLILMSLVTKTGLVSIFCIVFTILSFVATYIYALRAIYKDRISKELFLYQVIRNSIIESSIKTINFFLLLELSQYIFKLLNMYISPSDLNIPYLILTIIILIISFFIIRDFMVCLAFVLPVFALLIDGDASLIGSLLRNVTVAVVSIASLGQVLSFIKWKSITKYQLFDILWLITIVLINSVIYIFFGLIIVSIIFIIEAVIYLLFARVVTKRTINDYIRSS